jgi:two-component system, OmpR family, response regulator MprA
VRILVVEDEPQVRHALERVLSVQGYSVESTATGAAAIETAGRGGFDALLLDVNLPDVSGFDVCRRLRGNGDRTPVLMLTARDDIADRVSGLDAGADDYLVKPFALAELLARLRALLRRSLPVEPDSDGHETVSFGDVTLDLRAMEARRGVRLLDLTRTELLLLELFLRNPGHVLTRAQILDRVWGFDARTSSNGVEVYIGYLRRKLEADNEPRLIHTVRGFGYVLRVA